MILKIFTDGGSKGNPGPSSIGMVFYLDGREVLKYREDIGIATNNVAEYMAVIRALEKFKVQSRLGGTNIKAVDKIEFYSDSKLLVNQVNGLFKVKNAKIREFIFKIRILEQEINTAITYQFVPREKNQVADNLVND